MARIMKSTPHKSTIEQIFDLYIGSVISEGVKDKTIITYKQHFRAISKRLDVSIPISTLTSDHLDQMIQQIQCMRCPLCCGNIFGSLAGRSK